MKSADLGRWKRGLGEHKFGLGAAEFEMPEGHLAFDFEMPEGQLDETAPNSQNCKITKFNSTCKVLRNVYNT